MCAGPVVLVHAPLVGPSTWRWVAEALAASGEAVIVTDLHAQAGSASFERFVHTVATSVVHLGDPLLVGHSGSGVLLPFVAQQARLVEPRYVFVDAWLPPRTGSLPSGGSFRDSLDERVSDDGLMAPWHTWWGDAAMRAMVPDAKRRAIVCADMPRLAPTYGDATLEVPDVWASARGGYVLLSETYRESADAARSYGWPVEEVLGSHLEIVNRPRDVARTILRVAP